MCLCELRLEKDNSEESIQIQHGNIPCPLHTEGFILNKKPFNQCYPYAMANELNLQDISIQTLQSNKWEMSQWVATCFKHK